MSKAETRTLPAEEVRLVRPDDGAPVIDGYGIVFNSPSEVLNEGGIRFREIIAPEAVDGVLDGADIRALIDHETRLVLGRTSKGTLRWKVDERGVRVEIDPPETTYANDLLASMERGDIDGMSFKFSVAPRGDTWDTSGSVPVRTIRKFGRISEFSVVTFPAYPETEAAIRSLEEYTATQLPGLRLDAVARRLRIAEAEVGAAPFSARAEPNPQEGTP